MFFFYLAFVSRIFTTYRTAGEGGGYLLISFLPLPPFGTRSLEFTLSALSLVAAAVRKMHKTRVILVKVSRVLLNLIKILVFVIFKDSSLPMFTQLTAASHHNFCSLVLFVWLLSWYIYLIGGSLFTGRLRIALVFSVLTIAPFISESLLGNTPVTMAILQKRLGTYSIMT